MSDFLKTYIRNLQSKPKYSRYITVHWADYIELLCLANLDEELSQDDIIDRLGERERDLCEGDIKEIEELRILEEEQGQLATRRAEIDDTWKTRVEDWFRLLRVRSSLYGESYPFVITENEIKKKADFTNTHKIYIYLLICSNLYLLDSATRTIFANCFELVSHQALKNLLPDNSFVHLFGSNPLNDKGRYKNGLSLWNKIHRLAEDLREDVNNKIKQKDFPATNKGDDGLDLVAWLDTGDALPSMNVFFGQCACTTDWISKQHASHYSSWVGKINFTNHTNNIIFIPFCYRGTDGKWFKPSDIRLSFLIDRKRLIYYLGDRYEAFKKLPSAQIIERIIALKEDVV